MQYIACVLAWFLWAQAIAKTPVPLAVLEPSSRLFDWSSYLGNETTYRFVTPRAFTKIRHTLGVSVDYTPASNLQFFAQARAYYDLVYDLFDYDTVSAREVRDDDQPLTFLSALDEEKDAHRAELRELHLTWSGAKLDIKLGKQFIIWGVLTGVRLVDEINPIDFRELILLDLLDYRIPLWSLKIDYYQSAWDHQFIAIPDLTFHKPAPRGSEWELLQEVPGTKFPASYTLGHTEWGYKLATRMHSAELSMSYFYTWDDFPVIFRRMLINQNQARVPAEFQPTYKRLHILGFTAQTEWRGTVTKAELALVKDKYFGIDNIDADGDGYLDHEGVIKRPHLRWGLGADFSIGRLSVSPAITQWVIFDYDNSMIQDNYDSSVNLFAQMRLPNHNASLTLLGIYLVNLGELYIKPKLIFNVTNTAKLSVGFDLFSGDKTSTGITAVEGQARRLLTVGQSTQFLGNFNKSDRVFVNFKIFFN